ncbi:aspartic peptidase domain-containing protein [Xylaria sp. CBS 124048]|nr:aspartic peptidase domain-containing protein [Xylaria sp. CBS 124048]
MVQQSTAVALMALAGAAAAAPLKAKTGSFTARQVANPNFKPVGALQLAKAYNKYGAKMPPGLAATVAKYRAEKKAKRDSGSATATPEQFDLEYLTPVQIGTPPQTLNLDFDSGSSDLWVFSSETESDEVDGQTVYNPSNSSTAQEVSDAFWEIEYGDGSSSTGGVVHDVVSIGGVSFASQGVEVATQVSDQFTEDPDSDGLLGLAFTVLNSVFPEQEPTFFDNIAPNLDVAAWTADLKYHAAGSYDFGVIDSSKFTGEISYQEVDTLSGFWAMSADINGVPVTGIADTGTTLALLPDAVVNAYWSQINGAVFDDTQDAIVFPCNATLPDFTYSPGNVNITIPGEMMNWAPVTDTTCYGGLQSNGGIGLSIYGDIALKAAFVVFDKSQGAPRIGFATKDL